MPNVDRLVLIDGNAILHRAYHALPSSLIDKKGKQVNAVYGFSSILFKVVNDLKPTHLIVCFDRPEPTFRKQMYAGYQAQRPKMEDELIFQLNLIKKLVLAMEVPIYELAGFEADDVIGTLAFQAKSLKLKTQNSKLKTTAQNLKINKQLNNEIIDEIIIVTSDRDILQLVNNKVKIYMPVKGLSQTKLYGEQEVEEKYGIKPSQMIDYKALVGDPSDNYPGIKGIGPKTASQLLQKFGSLKKIYTLLLDTRSHVKYAGIQPKLVKLLSQGAEEAGMAKKLAEIKKDVPVALDIKKAKLDTLNKPKLREMFRKLGFKSLIKRLENKPKILNNKKTNQRLVDLWSKKVNKKKTNQQLKLV